MKITKFFAVALLGTAATIAAVAVLSTPAAATGHDSRQGDGGGRTEKNWDSDNLRFGSYTSASFRIPSHSYGTATTARYSHAACGYGGIADGYYQTKSGPSGVNDFPVLQYTSGSYSFKNWDTAASALPCDEFVRAQERMISEAASNGGHWLDSNGNLRDTPLPNWMRSRPVSLTYGTWGDKGPLFSARTGVGTDIGGNRYYYAHSTSTAPFGVTSNAGYQRRLDVFSGDAPATDWATYPNSATLEVVWGSFVANLRKLYPYTRPGVALHPQAQNMSATEAFYAYGRMNCFYTANLPAGQTDPAAGSGTRGLKDLGDNAFGCEYPYHPLPLCDPDPDKGSNSDWRAYTAPEIAVAGTVTQPFNKAAGADCANAPADPPQQAGFTADACVTASLEIYENRIVGSDAEPGVAASDRTLAVASGWTAWDLDVTSPHPLTASAPRDATAGSGDPDGCADGSESRADHASSR